MTDSYNYVPGDAVCILDGPWEGKRAIVQTVEPDVDRVILCFDHFGRRTPCEIEMDTIRKLTEDEWTDDLKRIHQELFGAS